MLKKSFGALLEVKMSKKCTLLWREAHFQVKMYKAHQLRITFGSSDVEKVPTVVVRSTFPSQNIQSTPHSDHFWEWRCPKNARHCGAKHISRSKCEKKCSDHFLTFRCRKLHTVVMRSTFPSQNCKKTTGFVPFLTFRCRKMHTD